MGERGSGQSKAAEREEASPPLGRQDVAVTEDEKLWIASRLIWFDQPRPPDSSSDVPKSRSGSRQLAK
ncbi:hypothetical protein STEG23_011945 [Scotinomys teguina]